MGGVIPAGAATGQTVYGQILDAKSAQLANGAGLEVFNPSDWGSYTNAMPEQSGSGRYILTVPGYLPAGRYIAWMYLCTVNSPTPTIGDTSLDFVFFDWDGANIIWLGSGVNMSQINGSTLAAANLAVSANQFVVGATAAGTLSQSQMTTNLTATTANIYNGRTLYFTSGVNQGLAVLITGYAVTGGQLTFIGANNQVAPAAPSAGDTFVII